jgi:hypothetical protein
MRREEFPMPLSDRDSFIALLDRLGSPEDAVALAAARDVDAQVRREGLSWDTLLVRPAAANDDDDDDAPGHVHAAAEDAAIPPIGDTTADISAIDRLMAVKDLSADTPRCCRTEGYRRRQFTDMTGATSAAWNVWRRKK